MIINVPIKTEKWAARNGYTHHGSIYGIPVWVSVISRGVEVPYVYPKNWLYELAYTTCDSVAKVAGRYKPGLLTPHISIKKEVHL